MDQHLPYTNITTLDQVREIATVLRERMKAAVQGRDDVIELVLTSLLGDGHVLLEDYPGSGKTTLAKALGESIHNDRHDQIPYFRRIQFTPDLLPSDITGVMIFDTEKNNFYFRQGPIFAYVALADEINRTSPKVQAALLEAMAEKQVTVENVTHNLDTLFFVIATQNPLDLVGTYPLPFAQLDRFLFKLKMEHITREAELEVLSKWKTNRLAPNLPKVTRSQIVESRQFLKENITLQPVIMETLVDIFRAIRAHPHVIQGASTRAMVLAMPALQARAVLAGRDYVSSQDLESILVPLLMHRVEFKQGVEKPAALITEISKPLIENLARATVK